MRRSRIIPQERGFLRRIWQGRVRRPIFGNCTMRILKVWKFKVKIWCPRPWPHLKPENHALSFFFKQTKRPGGPNAVFTLEDNWVWVGWLVGYNYMLGHFNLLIMAVTYIIIMWLNVLILLYAVVYVSIIHSSISSKIYRW